MNKKSYKVSFKLDIVASIEQRSRFPWTQTHTHTLKPIDKTLHTHTHSPRNKSLFITAHTIASKHTYNYTEGLPDKRGKYLPYIASSARHPTGESRASVREEKQKSWGTKFPPPRHGSRKTTVQNAPYFPVNSSGSCYETCYDVTLLELYSV